MRVINWSRSLVAMLGVALLTAIAACCLPDNPYQRWQLIEGTLYDNARWSYERSHFDPAPVDVAIFGPSRARLGLSAPRMEATLASLGKPARVANMAVIEDGRNVQWAIANELFKTKKPRVIVLAINEDIHRWGHPAFKYVAPAAAVALPPAPFLHNSLYDIAYLPYRQMRLFAASLFPDAFGLRTQFDPAHYAASRIDDSVSHRQEDGKWVEMGVEVPAEMLRAQGERILGNRGGSLVPDALTRITDADDHVYVTRIAELAAAHGCKVVFVHIPRFESARTITDRAFYERLGPIQDNGDLATQDRLFQGWAHLNRNGALLVSDRLAAAVAKLL